jgi:hypothetical protein
MSCDPGQTAGREAFAAAARSIIDSDNVWALAVDTMTRRGFAGDVRHVELLYAIFTSRLLKRPMCAFLKAPSSSGKSWLLNRTLELFPPESYEIKSGFSPKAIAYGSADLRHKVLAVQEASGLNGREGNMLVRTLISEGLIRWEVAGRDADGFTTRTITRPGPIAFVLTTTHETLHTEDETRALSIEVDDTPDHTREVMRNIGRNYAGAVRPAASDLAPWHAFQRWLDAGPHEVVIPFAEAMGALFTIRTNRSKRDFEQLLTAVAVSALLHQAHRTADGDGRITATMDDYEHARRFLHKPLNEAAGSAVPRGVREVVEQLLDHHDAPVTPYAGDDLPRGLSVEELATRMCVDKSVASRRVAQAKARGLVADWGGHRSRPARLMVVHPLPEDWDVLPDPAYVEAEARGELKLFIANKVAADTAEAEAEYQAEQAAAQAERAAREAAAAEAAPAAATEAGAPEPPPRRHPRLMPPIIANAPNPDREDGGYRGRRTIDEFKAAVEWWGKQN